MRKLASVYRRPITRFFAVGVANFVFTYVVYLSALLVLDYKIAFAVSFVAGLLFTSVMTIRHIFTTQLTILRVVTYGLYYLMYFFVNIRLIELLVEGYAVDDKVAPLISLALLTPVHFLLSKKLVANLARFN